MRRYVLLPLTVLLLVPAIASAATTAVTSVAVNGNSRFIVDLANPPMVDITGTADVSVTSVNLSCVSSQAGGGFSAVNLANNVPVTGGSFSAEVPWPSQGVCEVFATETGTSLNSNADLTGLTGKKVYPAYTDFSSASGKTYDYFVLTEGSGAEVGFDSFGDCTMDSAQLVQLHEYDGQPFDCNGYVEAIDQAAGVSTPSIVVDGHPAYPPYYIGSQGLDALPGWSDVTFGVSDEGGAWHVVSHEGIYRCSNSDAFPPSSCTGFTSTGVRLDVDEQLSPDARTIVQKLRFVSEDLQQHELSVVLNQTSRFSRQWFFPGTAGFLDYGLGAAPSVMAPAVATIRNRESGSIDPDITTGFGAITYGATPASEPFWNAGRYFDQRYPTLVIPAGKAARVEFIYNMAAGSLELDSPVAAAEASIGAPPAISVTSPASASAAAYTLTGTVNAPEALNAFTVNSQAVSVASDGTFSMPATLAAGANAFTLRATDELGRTATTPFNVTLNASTPPPPTTNTAPARVRFGSSGKLTLKGRSLTTGSTAACPSPGPDCTVAARATAAAHKTAKLIVVSKRSVTVKSGATVKIKLMLSKPAAKLLKRAHKLKVTLVLTGKRTGAPTATAKRTLKLSRRR
jgi:hypothetical protein